MAKKQRRTLGDKLRNSNKTIFVGREIPIQQFERNLQIGYEHEDFNNIFNVYGQGGVGKTTLLRQLLKRAKQNYLTAFIDTEDNRLREILRTMNAIAEEMAKQNAPFKQFAKRYKDYLQEKGKLEADPEKPKGTLGKLVKGSLKAGAKISREFVPGGSMIHDLAPVDAMASVAEDWMNFVVKKINNKDEVELVLRSLEVLTPLWIDDLHEVAEKKSIALFFDTYEASNPALDQWLLELIPRVPPNFLLVIGGRVPLDAEKWNKYAAYTTKISLEPFTEKEAKDYLAQRGVTEPTAVDAILSISGCLPVYLSLLAEGDPTTPEDIADPNEKVVARFLKHIKDPVQRQLALRAALPRKLNKDILSCLLPEKADSEGLFDWLKKRPFVQKRGGPWAYHPIVMETMLRHQKELSENDWERLHLRLAKHYKKQAQRLEIGEDRNEYFEDENWRLLQVEKHYHQLCANYKKYLPELVRDVVTTININAFNSAVPYTESLQQAAQFQGDAEWAKLMTKGIDNLITELAENDEIVYTLFKKINESHWITDKLDSSYCYFRQAYTTSDDKEEIALYEKAIELDSENAAAYINLGIVFYAQEEMDQAVEAYEKAIELDPKYAMAYNNLGCVFDAQEELDRAVEVYEKAIELDPKDAVAYYNLGNTFYTQEEWDRAVEAYEKAIALDPKYALAYNNLGSVFKAKEELDRAIAMYEKAIALDPKYALAYNNLGNAFYAQEQWDWAIAIYEKAIELDPKDTSAYNNLGGVFYVQEEMDRAITMYEKAIALDPKDAMAYNNLGGVFYAQEEMDRAIAMYEKAIELNPKYVAAYYNFGGVFKAQEELDRAITMYEKAIALDPKYTATYNNLGNVFKAQEEMDRAIAMYEKAIELDPKYAAAYNNLGNVFSDQEKWDRAIAMYEKAIELDPKYAAAYNNLGNVFSDQEKWDQAIAMYEKAIELDPEDNDAYHSVGWSYLLLGNMEQAHHYLLQTWDLSKQKHTHAPMNIGHVHLLKANRSAAIQWYRTSLSLWEDKEAFFKGMEEDYLDLKMEERGISKDAYEVILKELRGKVENEEVNQQNE